MARRAGGDVTRGGKDVAQSSHILVHCFILQIVTKICCFMYERMKVARAE